MTKHEQTESHLSRQLGRTLIGVQFYMQLDDRIYKQLQGNIAEQLCYEFYLSVYSNLYTELQND